MTDKPSREDILRIATECGFYPEVDTDLTIAELECFAAAMYAAGAEAEREVSDKLEKALVRLMASADASGYTANIGSMDESIKIADSALAEVAAIRATHTSREKAD